MKFGLVVQEEMLYKEKVYGQQKRDDGCTAEAGRRPITFIAPLAFDLDELIKRDAYRTTGKMNGVLLGFDGGMKLYAGWVVNQKIITQTC